ncbi:MAG: oligopeptide/dipeptide ABC transporter ATP-binding protein, partial [Dehalococcoidia bacterium]
PKLLIADEPTTALDVTVQAQLLDLIRNLCKDTGAAVMMITHDLGVVADICERVIVMYAGQIVETGSVDQLFDQPQHPYTQGLLHSVPRLGVSVRDRLVPIDGQPPDLINPGEGCRFRPRCPYATEKCLEPPPLFLTEEGQFSRCWLSAPAAEGLAQDAFAPVHAREAGVSPGSAAPVERRS